VEEYRKLYPDLADHLMRMQRRQLPGGWDKGLPAFPANAKGKATRGTSGVILTRQAVPTLDRTRYGSAEGLRKEAYVLADASDGKPDVLLLATGSEVTLCVQAYEQLKAEGGQGAGGEHAILGDTRAPLSRQPGRPGERPAVGCHGPRVGGAGVHLRLGAVRWARRAGPGHEDVWAWAPLKELQKKFGFTLEHVVAAARDQLALARR
jgi:transketolase